MIYLWIKSFHIIAVFSWVAGLLIYPRYKIHQLASEPGDLLHQRMQKASGQLRRIIMTPSLIATWLFGLTLVGLNSGMVSGWLWAKLVLVILLSALHGYFIRIGKKIDSAEPGVTERDLRLLNELPFILFALITVLVVVKPF